MSKALSKEEIIGVLRQQKDLLRSRFYVKNIGVFGSFKHSSQE